LLCYFHKESICVNESKNRRRHIHANLLTTCFPENVLTRNAELIATMNRNNNVLKTMKIPYKAILQQSGLSPHQPIA